MAEATDGQSLPERFPVAVILSWRETPASAWQSGEWSVEGIVTGGGIDGEGAQDGVPRLVHEAPGARTYLSTGFELELHADDAESYYQNLMAGRPAAFVLCDHAEDGSLQPRQVTLSYGEATSYMEMEEAVYTVPLPAELYRWLEHFVIEHYVPERRRKRRREDWKEAGAGARPPPG